MSDVLGHRILWYATPINWELAAYNSFTATPQNSISAQPSEFPPNSLPVDRAGLWQQGFSFPHSIDKTLSQQEPSGVEGN